MTGDEREQILALEREIAATMRKCDAALAQLRMDLDDINAVTVLELERRLREVGADDLEVARRIVEMRAYMQARSNEALSHAEDRVFRLLPDHTRRRIVPHPPPRSGA